MAKSAINRHHAKRIYKKWVHDAKLRPKQYEHKELSYGKVFKQDPWDCGSPQCGICTGWKVKPKAKRREALRRAERVGYLEIEE